MITIEEDIKTASQLKRVVRDAVLEYAKNNHLAHIELHITPIVIQNDKYIDELLDVHVTIETKL